VSPQVGYNGDEDQGLMGALAVLMKIGLFSMQGGCSLEPELELGSPVFDRVTIQLDPEYYPGKTLVIEARNNTHRNVYIQSARWNGDELNTWRIPQSDLVRGGTLVLEMGEKHNEQWGINNHKQAESYETK
ncbi:MAG: glycoside hydrolase domain-containing protein, partial [Prolixibacteraceae bacterium]